MLISLAAEVRFVVVEVAQHAADPLELLLFSMEVREADPQLGEAEVVAWFRLA